MAQSINHVCEFVEHGTAFTGFNEYGQIMTGDMGLEFFSDRNVEKNIQIPWTEVDVVMASVLFKGKYIPRIAVRTKKNGTFMFSCREPKKLLQAINKHIPKERMYRSWTLWDVIKRNFNRIFKKEK
ncbi:MAG: DUF956 family protein [Erysipelotrichaceae bacterium]|nr:DUF956 family protein [Erysipelotrichaceae bacterium]